MEKILEVRDPLRLYEKPLTQAQNDAVFEFKKQAKKLLEMIERAEIDGAEKRCTDHAKLLLESAVMWTVKGITA